MGKKKNDPLYCATDELIASDQWDSFDFNLRSELKALEKHYDNASDEWKKNTLAHTYLYYVEKLFHEKTLSGNFEFDNIRELRTLIKKYDCLKTFLLTVRIFTLAFRVGLIPDEIKMGHDYRAGQSRKGAKERTRDGLAPPAREQRNKGIIEDFKNALRKKSPFKNSSLTYNAFAKNHAAKYGLKPRQVRNILKMAVGN